MDKRLQLQIALLDYFSHAKTVRNAAKRAEFKDFTRKEILRMKDALLMTGLIQDNPSMKTSGVIYRTTTMGRQQLRLLKGEPDANRTPRKTRKPASVPRTHVSEVQA